MKYIKLFESNKFEVGDYVIIKPQVPLYSTNFNDLLKTHIGVISRVSRKFVEVDFIFNEDDLKEFKIPHTFFKSEVLYHSKSIEELEMMLNAGKYNL